MKFKYVILLLLSSVFVLEACDEDIDISVIEDDTELVESVSVDQGELIDDIIIFAEELPEYMSDMNTLVTYGKSLPKEERLGYIETVQDYTIKLRTFKISSPKDSEKHIHEQFTKLVYHVETMTNWATEYVNNDYKSTYSDLYFDERRTMLNEYQLLIKMME